MNSHTTRILATPKAFALLSDAAFGEDQHRAVRRAVELALTAQVKKKTGYLFQGCPLAIAARWADEEGKESVLILYGDGEMRRIAELEPECIPISFN